jgi:hypothetical protein
MPTIFTCGGPAKRTQFTYEGDFDNGLTIRFASGDTQISNGFLKAAIDHFRDREVKGGFSMTNPTPGGFGHWVENNSRALNTTPLTPRHGSFIAAILQEMGYLQCHLDGNAVILKFRA